MKIDFHTHTTRYSACSTISPSQLVERAINQGLEGLVFSEHNRFWPPDELKSLQDEYSEINLFNGAEIDVPSLDHVVTILPTPDQSVIDPRSPEIFREMVGERGGVTVAAHPFRYIHDYHERNSEYPLDFVEIASGNMNDEESIRKSNELAEQWDSKVMKNSDAHAVGPVGHFVNRIDAHPDTQNELLEILREERVEPL